jgi:carotenoid cleavage dioxygenase-like enzyme
MSPTTTRRVFLGQLGLGATSLLWGCGKSSSNPPPAGSVAAPIGSGSSAPAPATSLASLPGPGSGPPASLMVGCADELDLELEIVSGALPPDLSGHYLLVSAQPQGGGVFLFNGEGMLHRVELGPRPRLRSRLLRPPSSYADEATRGTSDAFHNIQGGPVRMSLTLGVRDFPNTAIVPLAGGRLLVTSDAARPYEVDPVSLDVVTPVGGRAEWRPGIDLSAIGQLMGGSIGAQVFPLYQSSAHPAYDSRSGELFTLNYGGNQVPAFVGGLLGPVFTDLLRWDGAGALERWSLVDPSGADVKIEQSAHQMAVTADYVLILDSAFRIEPGKFIDPASLTPQDSFGRIWIVRRADLSGPGGSVLARPVDLPRETAHLLADYANPGGRITVCALHNAATDGSEWLLPSDQRFDGGGPVPRDLLGFISAGTDLSGVGRHVIDGPAGKLLASELVFDDDLTWGHALYCHDDSGDRLGRVFQTYTGFQPELLPERVAQAYASYPHRSRPLASLPRAGERPGTLICFDVTSGRISDSFRFPQGWIPASPEFVPAASGGYVVCALTSDDASWQGSSGDELWIFAADDLAQGPLCRLSHPSWRLTFGLHTAWLPSASARSASYRVDVAADLDPEVSTLSPGLQDMFRRQVYPHF